MTIHIEPGHDRRTEGHAEWPCEHGHEECALQPRGACNDPRRHLLHLSRIGLWQHEGEWLGEIIARYPYPTTQPADTATAGHPTSRTEVPTGDYVQWLADTDTVRRLVAAANEGGWRAGLTLDGGILLINDPANEDITRVYCEADGRYRIGFGWAWIDRGPAR